MLNPYDRTDAILEGLCYGIMLVLVLIWAVRLIGQ